jgi:hypothetical protein
MQVVDANKVFEALNELRAFIDISMVHKDSYESRETNEINAALAKAQGEFPKIGYNKENPYFKSQYVDLDTIVTSIRPALSKSGLSFTQQTKINEEGSTILHTRLRHASGQWIESRARILPPKNDPQSYASTLTYMKRYSLMSLIGITASNDASDDDAEVAMIQVAQLSAI